MNAYVIVLQNPYFSLTDNKGNFEIKNVPPGTYQVKVVAGKTADVEFKGLTRR